MLCSIFGAVGGVSASCTVASCTAMDPLICLWERVNGSGSTFDVTDAPPAVLKRMWSS